MEDEREPSTALQSAIGAVDKMNKLEDDCACEEAREEKIERLRNELQREVEHYNAIHADAAVTDDGSPVTTEGMFSPQKTASVSSDNLSPRKPPQLPQEQERHFEGNSCCGWF